MRTPSASNQIAAATQAALQPVKTVIPGAKLIIVNILGRVRIVPDANQEGIAEKDNGSDISGYTSGF